MEEFEMFEKLMRKFGYVKNEGVITIIKDGDLNKSLNVIINAKTNKEDVFVDYVKKTNTQKFYVGNKKKLVLEV